MRKLIKIVINLILHILAIIVLSYFVLTLLGFKIYNVPTGSMEPNIHAGSLVVINPQKDYTDIKERDIIVYNRKSDNTLIIHRVVEITDDAIRTKGDANQSIDDINVTPDIYVGKYIFGIPKAGKIFDFFESKQNKAIYIIILLGICIIDVYLDKPAKKRKN